MKVALCVLSAAMLLFPALVEGSPLDCESIRDPDNRNMCRAVTKHEKSWCELIRNHDLRSRCRAEVR